MMLKQDVKIIEEDIKNVFAKHKIYLRGSIEFPNGKVPKKGKLALWLLGKCKAEVKLRVVPR